MCRDLEVRLIMNLGLRLGLIICRDLKILLGLLLELLEERELGIRLIMNLEIGLGLLEEINLEVLLLVLPHKIIFFMSIFLSRRSSYHSPPPTPKPIPIPPVKTK